MFLLNFGSHCNETAAVFVLTCLLKMMTRSIRKNRRFIGLCWCSTSAMLGFEDSYEINVFCLYYSSGYFLPKTRNNTKIIKFLSTHLSYATASCGRRSLSFYSSLVEGLAVEKRIQYYIRSGLEDVGTCARIVQFISIVQVIVK
jgi:hypothetical protein